MNEFMDISNIVEDALHLAHYSLNAKYKIHNPLFEPRHIMKAANNGKFNKEFRIPKEWIEDWINEGLFPGLSNFIKSLFTLHGEFKTLVASRAEKTDYPSHLFEDRLNTDRLLVSCLLYDYLMPGEYKELFPRFYDPEKIKKLIKPNAVYDNCIEPALKTLYTHRSSLWVEHYWSPGYYDKFQTLTIFPSIKGKSAVNCCRLPFRETGYIITGIRPMEGLSLYPGETEDLFIKKGTNIDEWIFMLETIVGIELAEKHKVLWRSTMELFVEVSQAIIDRAICLAN